MVVMLLNAKQIKSFKRKKDISSQNSKNKIYSDCENIFKNEKKKINVVSDEQKLKEFIAYPHWKKYYRKFSRLKKNEMNGSSKLQEGNKSTRRGNMW